MIEELYHSHKAELERFARAIASNEKEAEDLLQETFLRAITHGASLQLLADYSRRAWLFKVMRNLLLDLRRKDRFVAMLPDDFEAAEEIDFLAGLEMEQFLQNLPSNLRVVVHKRYNLGMNSKQIGELLGIPDSTVRYRLRTALQLLQKMYTIHKEE